MATNTEAPRPAEQTLFVRKASGLVKGWSTTDGFRYSFFSTNIFLGIWGFLYATFIPGGSVFWAVVITTALRAARSGGLRRPDLRHAARRRRLRVAIARVSQFGRLRARGHGLVVHPLALDPDLRGPVRELVHQADPAHPGRQRRRRLARQAHRRLRRLAGDHRPGDLPRGRGHEGLRHLPEVGSLDRPGRHRRGRRHPARSPRRPASSRAFNRESLHLYGTKNAYQATLAQFGKGMPSSMFSGSVWQTVQAHAVHAVLAAVAELGRDALRRGPRRQGLSQEHLPDGRRSPVRSRHRHHLPVPRRQDHRLQVLHGERQRLRELHLRLRDQDAA